MQDFDSELVPAEGHIPQVVNGPSTGNDSGSKTRVNLPFPTYVFTHPVSEHGHGQGHGHDRIGTGGWLHETRELCSGLNIKLMQFKSLFGSMLGIQTDPACTSQRTTFNNLQLTT